MGIESQDIDICTSATPKDILTLFPDNGLPSENYGSTVLNYKGVRFEITTFRKESDYDDFRRPNKVEFITSVEEDIKRRDFTINALLMNAKGEVIDYLNGKEDLNRKEICTIGPSEEKFKQDVLRILRAVRFATTLHFSLSAEVKDAILKVKGNLKELSYERKKKELDYIFSSPNASYGVSLLIELGLDKELELPNLSEVPSFEDLIGVWAFLKKEDIYPFSKHERELMASIREVMTKNIFHPSVLYYNDLYVLSVAALLLGKNKKEVIKAYNHLPIHHREDIMITSNEICTLLHKEEGAFLKEIWSDLEKKILKKELENSKEAIKSYLLKYYL